MIEIDLLYFDGCPSWTSGLANLETVLENQDVPYRIHLVRVDDPDQAQKERFLGSPSFRVDGVDLWTEERGQYALSCRVYQTPAGLRGYPTAEMLSEKLAPIFRGR